MYRSKIGGTCIRNMCKERKVCAVQYMDLGNSKLVGSKMEKTICYTQSKKIVCEHTKRMSHDFPTDATRSLCMMLRGKKALTNDIFHPQKEWRIFDLVDLAGFYNQSTCNCKIDMIPDSSQRRFKFMDRHWQMYGYCLIIGELCVYAPAIISYMWISLIKTEWLTAIVNKKSKRQIGIHKLKFMSLFDTKTNQIYIAVMLCSDK